MHYPIQNCLKYVIYLKNLSPPRNYCSLFGRVLQKIEVPIRMLMFKYWSDSDAAVSNILEIIGTQATSLIV